MWLNKFLELYPEAYKRVTGQTTDYEKLEGELRSMADTKYPSIGPLHLKLIEDEDRQYWTYPKWWPSASALLRGAIDLPADLHTMEGKKRAVEALYGVLRHIEVTSVVLRFMYPEEFGIISPPVVSLLNLIPAENETHPEHYIRYLRSLRDLSIRYGQLFSPLRALSKVDMGLWAAEHLSTDPAYASMAEEMHKDEFFQEIRLRNLAEGFGSHWTRTDAQRLILGRVLLRHDSILAALIASRAFESIVFEIVSRSGMQTGNFDENRDRLEYLIHKIAAKSSLMHRLGVTADELNEWRRCRNDTVHPKTGRAPMTSKRAKDFIYGVQRLFENMPKIAEEPLMNRDQQ
jgi:hypothetical protein